MAINYKRYLAEKVVGDGEHVTYRALSRALKVHCNHAKRMLYDFHHSENAKNPKSVNATYLITGVYEPVQKAALNGDHLKDGDDEIMQSSPFMSSQVAQQDEMEESLPMTSIILTREEDLSDVKDQFKNIFSIFIYSVQPIPPPDLNVLADTGHAATSSQVEDPLQYGMKYGMIQNKNVKRRSGLPAIPSPPSVKPAEAKKMKKAEVVDEPASVPSKEPSQVRQKQSTKKDETNSTSAVTSQQTTTSQPTAKSSQGRTSSKRDASSIFKAFAKAKPKSKKGDEPSGTSGMESGAPSELENAAMDEESGEEREDLFLDTGTRSGKKGNNTKERESRIERQEKLQKMMDDDEEMTDAPEPPPEESAPAAREPSPEETKPDINPPEVAPASNRRRRGRRQVMKKKTVRDAEGYLVTKEEPTWESFSEDEVVPPKRKPPVSSASGKSAKGGNKAGQGSIMAFFGKK